MTESISRGSHEREALPSSLATLRALGRFTLSACTLFTARDSSSYHRDMEKSLSHLPQPLHPSIETTVERAKEVIAQHATVPPKELLFGEKVIQSARMIQFTDHFSRGSDAFLHYEDMKNLKDRFVDTTNTQGSPLTYDQQLAITLQLSNGNVTDALTALCFSSRQYARWRDGVSIKNLPHFTETEIMSEMKEWRNCLLACKIQGAQEPQDPSGDTYYTWTHALARAVYSTRSRPVDSMGRFAFYHGTDIMRIAINNCTRRNVLSDHRVAAAYGNAIGRVIT